MVPVCGPAALGQAEITITTPPPPPVIGPLLRPFHLEKRMVSPARFSDSPRLELLIRGGNLYLTAQDVISLVLENNLDIDIQRYGPFLAREVQRRTEGGGYLRNVDTAVLAGPQSVSLAGVSVNANGLAGGTGVGSGGGIVSQIGPIPPVLDPNLYASFGLGHSTTPLTNTLLNQTSALTNDFRQYVFQYSQQFVTGTSGSVTYFSNRSKLNSPTPLLNPSTTGYIDLTINQNLLQGFSVAVNSRDIRVARNNRKVSVLQLKRQVITTVSAALNLYWDLVSFNESLRITERAVTTAEKLYQDNQNQAKLGALAPIEVTRAAAAVSTAKGDLLIAQTNVSQQETVLKNALSRSGSDSTWLEEAHIIPLDHIEVPKTEDLKPAPELIKEAVENRPELEQTRINLESNRILIRGDQNGLLPSLSAFAELTNNGLSGAVNPLYNNCCGAADAYFIGGYGNLSSQLLRRNFPNYSAGFSLSIPFRNRAAQADYATDQLQLRQTELQLKRALNQVSVEVKNAVIGLQQARARYETAVNTRALAEQSLEAEQNRFKYGAVPDATLVIQAQKDLATDQSLEVQAMANYTHAKIAFDEAVGRTLDANHITMTEAVSGRVARESVVPESVIGGSRR
ncbi:MAG: outer membrane protein [Bryobacterales bacterium]|nr:outer membrane protein [Bryobacterales bacterium]